jgi:hypothetical protein
VPRDDRVLLRLAKAAADAGLVDEEKLFRRVVRSSDIDLIEESPRGTMVKQYKTSKSKSYELKTYRPNEWRLMQAARIAVNFFPDTVHAIEQAAGPALELVDKIMATATIDDQIDGYFYDFLEQLLSVLAARQQFENLKKERGE